MDLCIPLDIMLAKLKNPLIIQQCHLDLLNSMHDKMPQIVNNNFELLADKYQLLSNALPGCSPELIVEEFQKLFNQVEQLTTTFLDRLRKIISDLQKFAEYDTQVLKGHLIQATDLFQRSFKIVDQDIIPERDLEFLMENFNNAESPLQNHLLALIFERNQNLQNVMQKVYQEQVEFSQVFLQQFTQLSTINHFDPLNRLLNNQKQFWNSRVKSQVNLQKKLLDEQQQQQLQMSSIYQVPDGNQQLIDAMLKLRTHTHDLMLEHVEEIKQNKGKKHCKLDGGGSFGYLRVLFNRYCWTGGYGWRGLHYEYLGLNHECPQCHILNQDMNSTAKKLYELEYRDKGTWWVVAWFLYLRS